MNDIVLLKIVGVNPVIVHGGGKAITAAMDRMELPVEFKDGQRVTTPEAMDVVRTVLMGTVNQELVAALNEHGNFAVGVSGADAGVIVAEQATPELGRVGRITRINRPLLDDLVEGDYIPVVASVALGEDGGFYNVNADMVAGHIAAAIGAHKVVFLTDVDGLYENFENKESLISNLTLFEAQYMVENNIVSTGMIPKLKSCIHAGFRRVPRPHHQRHHAAFASARAPHQHGRGHHHAFHRGGVQVRRAPFGQLRLKAGESPACWPARLTRGGRRDGAHRTVGRGFAGSQTTASRKRERNEFQRRASARIGIRHGHVRPQARGAGPGPRHGGRGLRGAHVPRFRVGGGRREPGHCHPALVSALQGRRARSCM